MPTKLNEGIWVGNNDDAHKVQELVAAQVTLDFSSAALGGGAYGTASGVMPGARSGMMFFIGPWDVSPANISASAVVPVSIICQTADTITVSATTFATAAIDMGSAQYPVIGIRRT